MEKHRQNVAAKRSQRKYDNQMLHGILEEKKGTRLKPKKCK
jgi:hypothetical protein